MCFRLLGCMMNSVESVLYSFTLRVSACLFVCLSVRGKSYLVIFVEFLQEVGLVTGSKCSNFGKIRF